MSSAQLQIVVDAETGAAESGLSSLAGAVADLGKDIGEGMSVDNLIGGDEWRVMSDKWLAEAEKGTERVIKLGEAQKQKQYQKEQALLEEFGVKSLAEKTRVAALDTARQQKKYLADEKLLQQHGTKTADQRTRQAAVEAALAKKKQIQEQKLLDEFGEPKKKSILETIAPVAKTAAVGIMAVGAAAVAAGGAVAGFVTKLTLSASESEASRLTFGRLTEEIGSTGEAMTTDLRGATRGMVSDANLWMGSNKLMAAGLVTTGKELSNVAEMGTQLGVAMGMNATDAFTRFNQVLVSKSIPQLEQFGINSAKVKDRVEELTGSTKLAFESEGDLNTERTKTIDKIGELENRLKLATMQQDDFNKKTKDTTRFSKELQIDKLNKELEEMRQHEEALDGAVIDTNMALKYQAAYLQAIEEQGRFAMERFGEQGEGARQSLERLQSTLKNIGDGIGRAFLPAMDQIATAIQQQLLKYEPEIKAFADNVGKWLGAELPGMLEEGAKAMETALAFLGENVPKWVETGKDIADGIADAYDVLAGIDFEGIHKFLEEGPLGSWTKPGEEDPVGDWLKETFTDENIEEVLDRRERGLEKMKTGIENLVNNFIVGLAPEGKELPSPFTFGKPEEPELPEIPDWRLSRPDPPVVPEHYEIPSPTYEPPPVIPDQYLPPPPKPIAPEHYKIFPEASELEKIGRETAKVLETSGGVLDQAAIDMFAGWKNMPDEAEASFSGVKFAAEGIDGATRAVGASVDEMGKRIGTGVDEMGRLAKDLPKAYEGMNYDIDASLADMVTVTDSGMAAVDNAMVVGVDAMGRHAHELPEALTFEMAPYYDNLAGSAAQGMHGVNEAMDKGAKDMVTTTKMGGAELLNAHEQLWNQVEAQETYHQESRMDSFKTLSSNAIGETDILAAGVGSSMASMATGTVGSITTMATGMSGAWDGVQTAASGAWDGVQSAVSGAVTAIQGEVETVATGADTAWSNLQPAAATAWEGVTSTVSGAITAIQTQTAAVAEGADTAWTGMETAAAGAWAGVTTTVAGAITTIQAQVATISTGASTAWAGMQTAALGAWAGVQGVVAGAITAIQAQVATIATGVSTAWAGLQAAASAAWAGVTAAVSGAISGMQGIISGGMTMIRGAFSSAMGSLRGVVTGAMSAVRGAFTSAMGAIQGVVSGAMGAIRGIISGAMGTIRGVVTSAMGAVKGAISGATSVVRGLGSAFSGVASTIAGAVGRIVSSAQRAAAALRSIKTPSALTGQSPSPFENTLIGVNKLMREMSQRTIPGFNTALAGTGMAQENNYFYTLNVNSSASTEPIIADFMILEALAGA